MCMCAHIKDGFARGAQRRGNKQHVTQSGTRQTFQMKPLSMAFHGGALMCLI